MTRSSRRSIEVDQTASFQDTIEDSGRHIVVVEYLAPLPQGFIGGEDHGPLSQVPVIDHMEQDVGGIGSIRQVAELVDHQYMRVGVVTSDSWRRPFLLALERSSMSSAAVVNRVSQPFWIAR